MLKQLLQSEKYAPLIQFIKFGLVGVSNTAISYAVEMLCYYVLFAQADMAGVLALMDGLKIALTAENAKIIVTSLISFVVSVTNSYYWNSRHVFKTQKKRTAGEHLRGYLKTVACYALTGLLLAPWLKTLLVGTGIPFWGASLLSLIVTIPLNFLMNKFWAFKA